MNPTTGTLISEDAYAGKLSKPYTLHKYMYANNNPVKYIDPSGNEATISEYATAEAIMGVLATVAVFYVRYAYELSQNIRWSGISVGDTVGSTLVDQFKLEAKKPEEAADAARDAGEVVEEEVAVAAGASPSGEDPEDDEKKDTDGIPEKAKSVAEQVKSNNGAPPKGYKGGRKYKNIPKQEGAQKLPEGVNYREYDVNPFVKGQNRGTERIVIGDDGTVWYTNDHYLTFIQIK